MNPSAVVLLALIVVDVCILAALATILWAKPFSIGYQVDRRSLLTITAGLAGFAFHAYVFFSGTILIVQLTTIAMAFGICLFSMMRRTVTDSPA